MNIFKQMTNELMVTNVTFSNKLIIDYRIIESKHLNLDRKLINADSFIFDNYIRLQLINEKFGLDGVCSVINDVYFIKRDDKYSLIKMSNYSYNYYNWMIDNLLKLVIFIKINYAYQDTLFLIGKNFTLSDIIRDNYIIYWKTLLDMLPIKKDSIVEIDNNTKCLIEYMIHNCNSVINFHYIQEILYMILDNNTHIYSSLVANYGIKQDCDRINMLIKHFDHLMLYIIHLGFKQIINVIK